MRFLVKDGSVLMAFVCGLPTTEITDVSFFGAIYYCLVLSKLEHQHRRNAILLLFLNDCPLAVVQFLTFHNIYLTEMVFNIISYSLNLCLRIGLIYGSVSK